MSHLQEPFLFALVHAMPSCLAIYLVARAETSCGTVARQECARYLETYKAYESKPADAIQGRTEEDYLSKLTAALTTVRGVNKTDVLTLGGAFKTAAGVMRANMQQLSALPGIGPTKACIPYAYLLCFFTKGLMRLLDLNTVNCDAPHQELVFAEHLNFLK